MKLGKETKYKYQNPEKEIFDTFENPKDCKSLYEITFISKEFTSLCPKTGQPDFAKIKITYTPNKVCLETKSLKLYLIQFRMYEGFMEAICNKVADDLYGVLSPIRLEVIMSFTKRGGIKGIIRCKR